MNQKSSSNSNTDKSVCGDVHTTWLFFCLLSRPPICIWLWHVHCFSNPPACVAQSQEPKCLFPFLLGIRPFLWVGSVFVFTIITKPSLAPTCLVSFPYLPDTPASRAFFSFSSFHSSLYHRGLLWGTAFWHNPLDNQKNHDRVHWAYLPSKIVFSVLWQLNILKLWHKSGFLIDWATNLTWAR